MKELYLIRTTVLFVVIAFGVYGQQPVVLKQSSKVVDNTTNHKVMLVPFEPRLYLSEMDYSINKQTGWSAREIKHHFRNGIARQCSKALKAKGFKVVDLMEDTSRYGRELKSIYSNLSYDYDKIPDQEKYKAPENEKKQKGIEKGQIQVETTVGERRFMNAKLTNAKLVPLLYSTYKTDVFIFINELDLKSGMDAANNTGVIQSGRKIVWHYTIYSYDAVELNSGVVEQDFPVKVNDPDKIVQTYFSQMASTLSTRLVTALSKK